MTRVMAGLIAVLLSWCGNALAAGLSLELPIRCEIGRDCFIQQYVDVDPGSGARDHACAGQTYDGHKGTDIRIRTVKDAEAGVAVLAAADGVVRRLRDGVPDRLVRGDSDRQAVAERECGNGVLLDHGGGWETQYCHMKNGSVRVAQGDTVRVGDVLGLVGYSGKAAFPHVHLDVRHNGKVVDPFLGVAEISGACGAGAQPLWSPDALTGLTYRRGQVLDVGFAGGALELADLEAGTVQDFVPATDSPALVAWGWAINLEAGDRVVAVLAGPDGELARSSTVMASRKAQYFAFAGKKLAAARWPAGRYAALFGVARNGKPVLRAGRSFIMP